MIWRAVLMAVVLWWQVMTDDERRTARMASLRKQADIYRELAEYFGRRALATEARYYRACEA